MDKVTISKELTIVFFIAILVIDWLYILSIQREAPIINYWVIALPIIIPLFSALALLALIGIYLANPWGFILAYFTMLLSMYFASVSYDSIANQATHLDWQFVILILLNIVIFCYTACFQAYLTSNNQRSK